MSDEARAVMLAVTILSLSFLLLYYATYFAIVGVPR